jgi:hypothetical protein
MCHEIRVQGINAVLEAAIINIDKLEFIDDLRAFPPDIVVPCLGMYSLREFDAEASSLGVYHQAENELG